MTITPAPDVELDLAAVPAAIRGAGFTPADMELEARGEFGRHEGQVAFHVQGWTTWLRARTEGEPPGGEVTLRARVEFDGPAAVLVPRPP